MYPNNAGERMLTELDFTRLSKLNGGQLPEALAMDLRSAELVQSRDIAPDVVTMYSQVEIIFSDSGLRQKVTVSYPCDAEPELGFISVLSPIGAALVGRRLGEVCSWRVPNGQERSAQVATILFQPEASGDYTT
ncbi:GreA/GreB family elongation factor [Polaromonas hydrogenivorans]|uniref:GreA/GreB family elongation factor n=1 Tax=Polaromonas hydrogenivorans TaxID=335476 RepID=A0AAU7LY45_9BURK